MVTKVTNREVGALHFGIRAPVEKPELLLSFVLFCFRLKLFSKLSVVRLGRYLFDEMFDLVWFGISLS